MKKTILRYFAGIIPLIAIVGSAYAQTVNMEVLSNDLPVNKYAFDEMKAEGGRSKFPFLSW